MELEKLYNGLCKLKVNYETLWHLHCPLKFNTSITYTRNYCLKIRANMQATIHTPVGGTYVAQHA